jgi:hypothetical protein
MPLELTDDEKNLILSLAAPIDRARRDQFLREVAAAIEERAASEIGEGLLHRVARGLQRRFVDPPDLRGGVED